MLTTELQSVTGEAARPDSPTMQRVTDRKKSTPSWAASGAAAAAAELVIGEDDDDDDAPLSPPRQPSETKVHGKRAALEALRVSGSIGDDDGDSSEGRRQRAAAGDDVLSSAHVLTLSGMLSDSAEVDHLAPPPQFSARQQQVQPRGSAAPRGSGVVGGRQQQGWATEAGPGGDVVSLRPSTTDAARIAAGKGAGPSHGRYDDISLSDSDDEDEKKWE
jgi:hypothetical protein